MHPMLMTQLAAARNAQLRSEAASERRGRLAVRRGRRTAQARRAARPARVAHA
jgi:hypothetical protein